MDQELIARARREILGARYLTVLTGAGISAESGVPTFRGPGGLWENHRPEELATLQAFQRDPALVWRWYNWRRKLISRCRPGPAHRALVELEARVPRFTLITQNVDGLHALAGSREPLEIHGSIWVLRCLSCGLEAEDHSPELPTPPQCPDCGGILRPGVVWFGETLDPRLLAQAQAAARSCQVMLVVGTSALVQPAAGLAGQARDAGALVVEVNLEPTPNTQWVDISLLGRAGEILPRLVE